VKTVEQAIEKGKRYLEFIRQQKALGKFDPSINQKAWRDAQELSAYVSLLEYGNLKARDKKKIAKSILRLQ